MAPLICCLELLVCLRGVKAKKKDVTRGEEKVPKGKLQEEETENFSAESFFF